MVVIAENPLSCPPPTSHLPVTPERHLTTIQAIQAHYLSSYPSDRLETGFNRLSASEYIDDIICTSKFGKLAKLEKMCSG